MLQFARVCALTILVTVALEASVDAQTPKKFYWDRGTDPIHHYEMYRCTSSPTCVPGTTPADRIGVDVPQPGVGVTPTMAIPVGTQGRAAVLAVDAQGTKSGLSNVVPFGLGPASPTGLQVK